MMIRLYLKFLYIVYRFYTDFLHERDMPVFYTGGVSSLMLFVLFFTAKCWWDFINEIHILYDTSAGVFIILLIWVLNYFVFIKPKKFLKSGFELHNREIIAVVIFLGCFVVQTVIVLKLGHDRNHGY